MNTLNPITPKSAEAPVRSGLGGIITRLFVCLAIIASGLLWSRYFSGIPRLASGLSIGEVAALLAGIMAVVELAKLGTLLFLSRRRKPVVEGHMIGRIYNYLGWLGVALGLAYGFGKLSAFGSVFAMFGGMLLGWSLQAPVSGLAAHILVSIKRPFRPGDRIQFPNLGLTGDVKALGVMYTTLDQVGGTIGSEEAVGRYILVPNAMLFSQVVINYTVTQEAAFMLDEVVIRITYDSHWDTAEQILIKAAWEVTGDIIKATGTEPYVRCDWYDYGVYLRLRYQTRVKDRVLIAYRIQKKIFEEVQKSKNVDLAIPYVYSYRSGVDRRSEDFEKRNVPHEVAIELIDSPATSFDASDVEQVAKSISGHGLLQPIVLAPLADGRYEIVAGHLRYEACKRLGWKMIPSIVKPPIAASEQQRATK